MSQEQTQYLKRAKKNGKNNTNKNCVSLNRMVPMSHLHRTILGWTYLQDDVRKRQPRYECLTPVRSVRIKTPKTPTNLNKKKSKIPKNQPKNPQFQDSLFQLPINFQFQQLSSAILRFAVKNLLVKDIQFKQLQKQLLKRYPQQKQMIRQTIMTVIAYLDS